MLVVFSIVVLLMLAGFVVILLDTGGSKQKAARQNLMMRKVFRFLSNFFVTQFSVLSIYRRLAILSIYKRDELEVLSVRLFLVSWGVGGGLLLFSLFVFHDFITFLLIVFFAFVLSTILIDKRLDSLNNKVMKALSYALSSIRQEYLNLNNVVEALNTADIPALVRRPIEEIASILVDTNAELKLQEFIESTPFRTLQTLAGVCFSINNQGDEKDAYGQSAFISALTLMVSDTNSLVQKTSYRKKAFGYIEYLPLFPILVIGIVEHYFVSIMPGTALIYDGPLGYVLRTATVVLSMLSYTIISRINMAVPMKEDDRNSILSSLLERPRIHRFVYNLTPKNASRRRAEVKLKKALSRMSIEHFYFKKILLFGVSFIFTLVFLYSAVSLGRNFIIHSTQSLSLISSGKQSVQTIDEIRRMDRVFMSDPSLYSQHAELKNLVTTYMSQLQGLEIQSQERRLLDKARSFKSAYFHWWFVWVAVAVGWLGWLAPDIMLYLRKTLIRTEEEDDFIQLQTLMSILINTNIDTLDVIGELARYSRIHQDMFTYAYHGFPSNPELEIARLQAKTPLVDFKRFIGKLKLTVSDMSLKEAYSDLLIEREHLLRLRDMALTASINRKRSICGPISMIPLGALILGQFLIPIGVLGFNQFMSAIASMKMM